MSESINKFAFTYLCKVSLALMVNLVSKTAALMFLILSHSVMKYMDDVNDRTISNSKKGIMKVMNCIFRSLFYVSGEFLHHKSLNICKNYNFNRR